MNLDALLDALEAAGDEGLTHEAAEAALGVDADRNPRERTAVKDAMTALRDMKRPVGVPEIGVYVLVRRRRAA